MIRNSPLNRDTPTMAIGGRLGAGELEGDAAEVLDWLRKPVEVHLLVERVEAARHRTGARLASVLHVEDDPDVVRLIAEALEGKAAIQSADGIQGARQKLARTRFDLVILDLSLADGSGVELLSELKREGMPPVIVFSAQDSDPETAGRVDAFLTKARTPLSSLVELVASLVHDQTRRDRI